MRSSVAAVVSVIALSRSAGADSQATQLFDEGRALSAEHDYAGACEKFTQSFELESAPGTELNLGDCYEHMGNLDRAAQWFRDARRRFALAGDFDRAEYARVRAEAIAAQSAPPPATDSRERAWRIGAWSAAATSLASAGLWFYGNHLMNDASARLCEIGGYYNSDASCPMPTQPATAAQVQRLNDQGYRGQLFARVGGAVSLMSGAFAAVAFYEGYVVERRKDRVMVIAPIISADHPGATLRVDW